MASSSGSSPLLTLPRELREEVLGYLTLPEFVYTSSSTRNTENLHRLRKPEKTYVETRIYLPSHSPANVLATCRQLRQECLEHHAHLLNSSAPTVSGNNQQKPLSSILAERLGTEFSEEAERACDDGTLRITLEVQRHQRGLMGYSIPTRDEVSPRFLALLPLMNRVRKLRLVVWPGYDWWNGGQQAFQRIDTHGKAASSIGRTTKSDAVSVAIGRILKHLPSVEELSVHVLMIASEGGRWDLPDNKWEGVQPWLDVPVTVEGGAALKKVTRKFSGFWKPSEAETFYTQLETRQGSAKIWQVERKGDMRTPTLSTFCAPEDLEMLGAQAVDERFQRTD